MHRWHRKADRNTQNTPIAQRGFQLFGFCFQTLRYSFFYTEKPENHYLGGVRTAFEPMHFIGNPMYDDLSTTVRLIYDGAGWVRNNILVQKPRGIELVTAKTHTVVDGDYRVDFKYTQVWRQGKQLFVPRG